MSVGNGKFQLLSYLKFSGGKHIRRIVESWLSPVFIDNGKIRQLQDLGAQVGLSESEVESATSSEHYKSAIGRFCTRVLFLIVLSFAVFYVLAYALGIPLTNLQPPPSNSTYIPGTRYGSLSPKDFR